MPSLVGSEMCIRDRSSVTTLSVSAAAFSVPVVSLLSVAATAESVSGTGAVSYTHLRAHETRHDLVCRLLLEKKKSKKKQKYL